MATHFVSATCRGEHCSMCPYPATHKVGEEIAHDAPNPIQWQHNLTAYICCFHFGQIMGPLAARLCGDIQSVPLKLGGES